MSMSLSSCVAAVAVMVRLGLRLGQRDGVFGMVGVWAIFHDEGGSEVMMMDADQGMGVREKIMVWIRS